MDNRSAEIVVVRVEQIEVGQLSRLGEDETREIGSDPVLLVLYAGFI